ncbi:MAG: AMP-binding protein, partial [Candidatus Binatia bacterium]
LSHHNLLSNLEALRQVLAIEGGDCVLGVLPFSNALGFTATLWLPAITGFRATYAPSASAPGLGGQCRERAVTLLPASPEGIEAVVGTVDAADLGTLRFAAVGGGALTEESRRAFIERFGVEPALGYGSPECAPIVSLNLPDVEHGKSRQVGTRPGTSGHPLPGVSVRIVDRDSGAVLPPGAEGLLEIRGPNVFSGYVNDPERTRQVLVDGWFRTGEAAVLDEYGFLNVRGGV